MKDFKYLQKLFFLLVMFFSLCTLQACGSDDEEGSDEPFDIPSKNTADIAVTGAVNSYGVTYASVTGYANLNFLPAGSDNPEIGVELSLSSDDTEIICLETSDSLTGNVFTVSFSKLYPNTGYKYRSFVRCADTTYYATEYRNFTTRPAYNVTSTSMVTDVTYSKATLTIYVQTDSVDAREHFECRLAYYTAPDLQSRKNSLWLGERTRKDTVTLTQLYENTTYYYASYTSFNGVCVYSDVKSFTTKELEIPRSDAVDLGLPSGLKWAAFNVGASSPEEYGDYFAWGETKPKSSYDEDNSTTYGLPHSDLESSGIVDSDGNLTASYDAATVNWGSSWRMPTEDEMRELLRNCSKESIGYRGVMGFLFTGPNGNSIFLPCYYYYRPNDDGTKTNYWSASLKENSDIYSGIFGLTSRRNIVIGNGSRYYGYLIRPVSDE